MVESAMEFVRICQDFNYHDIILSMKASNPTVMVHAYRLLIAYMRENGTIYPIHLGVTEAGEGEDGRIKSAVGIGSLLADGIGDTVRVSLTEDPEFEAPVAKSIIDYFSPPQKAISEFICETQSISQITNLYKPYSIFKNRTIHIDDFGADNVPRVIIDFSKQPLEKDDFQKKANFIYLPQQDKWKRKDICADYIYLGKQPIPKFLPQEIKVAVHHSVWADKDPSQVYPVFTSIEALEGNEISDVVNFLYLKINKSNDIDFNKLSLLIKNKPVVLMIDTDVSNPIHAFRYASLKLLENKIKNPICWYHAEKGTPSQDITEETSYQINSSCRLGAMMIDGFTQGIIFPSDKEYELKAIFGLYQSVRLRISKTEYISCPSCGRTLFNLQEVTAKIRKRTEHLKNVKIGIMGCIVNGPGEMADADFGYVGTGIGKISLYKGQKMVKKSIDEGVAVDALIDLIKEHGMWIDPTNN